MAWPKNAQKKIADLEAQIESLHRIRMAQNGAVATLEQPNDEDAYDIVLAFKVTRQGPFHGLWQLYRIERGVPKKIGAETSRLSAINLARNVIATFIP